VLFKLFCRIYHRYLGRCEAVC